MRIVDVGGVAGGMSAARAAISDEHDEVRAASAGRSVRVLCACGLRSAIAHRALVQEGFESASLSGRMLALRAARGHRAGAAVQHAA